MPFSWDGCSFCHSSFLQRNFVCGKRTDGKHVSTCRRYILDALPQLIEENIEHIKSNNGFSDSPIPLSLVMIHHSLCWL